jgi:MFS family permease
MGAYATILRIPHLKPLLAASLLTRLPIGINGLATLLYLRERTGSYAIAGAVAGALALGGGLGAPIGARLVDRFGPRALVVLALCHATGLLGLLALGHAGAPAVALIAAGLVTGVALPPTSSVMRALYPTLMEHREALVQSAFALDSVITEMIFIAGPLLTAVLVAAISPGAALVLSAAAVASGVFLFLAAIPPSEEADADVPDGGRLGALRAPGIQTLVLSMLPVGFAFGMMEVAIPAFATDRGRPELAGVLTAVWSLGSVAGGLAYGARARQTPLARVHLRVALMLPFGFLPVALGGSPAAMALLVLPAGVFIAPLIATRNELAGKVAPPGSMTEALTWPLAALVGGVSLGAAAAGGIVEAGGWRTAVLGATLAAAVGALVSLARRRTLQAVA